mmetsp:Transcript_15585/g.37172  ORF Transcript_15585/g.37172 Transcript_15585/m.37172 type:complete len:238 (+) Transcript_15585:1600-2313(+)
MSGCLRERTRMWFRILTHSLTSPINLTRQAPFQPTKMLFVRGFVPSVTRTRPLTSTSDFEHISAYLQTFAALAARLCVDAGMCVCVFNRPATWRVCLVVRVRERLSVWVWCQIASGRQTDGGWMDGWMRSCCGLDLAKLEKVTASVRNPSDDHTYKMESSNGWFWPACMAGSLQCSVGIVLSVWPSLRVGGEGHTNNTGHPAPQEKQPANHLSTQDAHYTAALLLKYIIVSAPPLNV